MVTPGHMACEAVTAMRWLSNAHWYRYRHKDATCRHPVGRGRRDGDARRHPGDPGHRDAVTAMRWLSNAHWYRYRHKDATCRHPVGRGRRDGDARRHPGDPGHRDA